MINYEVNLEIEKTVYENFLAWLPEHIKELLQLEGFQNAFIFEDNSSDTDLHRKITVHYKLDTIKNLQDYFDNHAAIVRGKTVQMFGDKVKASRRILKLTQSFCK